MVCGCIDIGSNTTRVLVADASDGQLRELLQRRAFTRIGKGMKPGAEIPRAKIEEVAGVVASHRELAEQVGAHPVRTVATAAIRGAANRDEVVEVGGGSTEVAVGTVEAGVSWWASFRLGSGQLADEYLRSDPPAAADLRAMRAQDRKSTRL